MKKQVVLGAAVAILAAVAWASPVQAQSLAGDAGDKRYPIRFSGSPKDVCAKAYKQYVAVNRHAAYAQTPNARMSYLEAYFCGIAAASTKEQAERQAVKNCDATGKKYKLKTAGSCKVYASK